MKVDVNQLFEEFGRFPQVEAIALGGSRATGRNDEKSDYDVYIYITDSIDEKERQAVLSKYCKYMEIGNSFWELEDDVTLNDGIDMDIIYRDMKDFENMVSSVVTNCVAWNGYTTCMWHNLKTCKIIYDRDGRLQAAKDRFNVPYPKQLKKNIIDRNMNLLSEVMPAYKYQIEKAAGRNDLVSVCHRTAAFMESYFDIIWAMNELTHPGEKRLVSLCQKQCKILPANFEANINQLYADLFTNLDKVNEDVDAIIVELKKVV